MPFRKLQFTIFLILVAAAVDAQDEVLVNLSSYPLPAIKAKITGSKTAKGPLSLPFFDDFARGTSFPTSDLWEVSGVTANQNYAINPPTIGVATFDAVNSNGELYPTLTTTPHGADTLTSRPINLSYLAGDSIYLSFSFQPQGLGYQPSSRDSLVLEFWNNTDSVWARSWSTSVDFLNEVLLQKNILAGSTKTTASDSLGYNFYNAIVNIDDPGFLTSNFRFRFINYASISSNSTIPGMLGNSDHWHIDMVYLNHGRYYDDTLYNDIAFSRPIQNLMKNYTSIPWRHFPKAASSEINDPREFCITYRNLGTYEWNVSRRFEVIDISNSQPGFSFSGGSGDRNILPFENFSDTIYFDYDFTSAWQDSAIFLFKSNIILYNTKSDDIPTYLLYNDTISKVFEFHNYYALDDGSAERGYGLYGQGSENGMVACKFHNYKADTLKGMAMYFNRTYGDANAVTFKLTVWDCDVDGKPGSIICQKTGVTPVFTDSLNRFTVYRITPTYIPEGDFFVGWAQTTDDMLNVGSDVNTNNQSRIFYNISGDWENTKYEGSLMIRPIFGNMYQIPTNTDVTNESELTIYPNPASDYITLGTSNNATATSIQIISVTGRVVLNQTGDLESINIQRLPEGLYIVKVCPKSGKCVTSKLLIVR